MFGQQRKRTSRNSLLCGKSDLDEGAFFSELKEISELNKSFSIKKSPENYSEQRKHLSDRRKSII